jgi:4-hydroxybenzoate polyprenyltransferase
MKYRFFSCFPQAFTDRNTTFSAMNQEGSELSILSPGLTVKIRRVRPWLQLLRLPNLFTVPGDALAGAVIATAATGSRMHVLRLLAAGLAVLCLYAYGLIFNDICDFEKDRQERPERPLPQARISLSAARTAAYICVAAGLVLALAAGSQPFAAALLLLVLITTYDLMKERVPELALPTMGLCRGLSFLLGAGVAGWSGRVAVPAAGLTIYVAAVTAIADKEDRVRRFGPVAAIPLGALLVTWLSSLLIMADRLSLWRILAAVLIVAPAVAICTGLQHEMRTRPVQPQFIRQSVGVFLRNLMFLQASLLIAGGSGSVPVLGIVLLSLWPVAELLSRRFQAS